MQKFISKNLFSIALFFLICTSGIGLMMRYTQSFGCSGFDISKWLQGHSHVSFLGWGFLAVLFLLNQKTNYSLRKTDVLLYLVLIFSLFGMLVFFPLFGYKLIPILFLALFLITSYAVLIRYLKYLKNQTFKEKKWISTAIFYYFLSSIVVWMVPIVILKFGRNEFYYNLIYFYLHFLYNGFFTFVLWGLIFNHLREKYQMPDGKSIQLFFILMQMAVIPTYVLSLYWNPVAFGIEVIGILSAILQLVAILILLGTFLKQAMILESDFTLLLIIGIFGDKILMQFLGSFYDLSHRVIMLKPYFVVGYLHWFTIGFITFSLLWLSEIIYKKLANLGFSLLVLGFFITEIILFYKGSAVLFGWNINALPFSGLFYGSFLMFIGILMLFIASKKNF